MVFCGLTTRRALLRLQPRNGLLLGLSASGIRQVLRRLSERSGMKIAPHSLRRFAATQMLRHGADLISVQRILGHRQVSTTATYLLLTEDDLRMVHEKTGPVDAS